MPRPMKGYTVQRKIKDAKKCVVHLQGMLAVAKTNNEMELLEKINNRIKFWEEHIVKLTPVVVKKK